MEPVYSVVEFFESISGEVGTTIPQGERTWFLRFAGCSLQCKWCDSQHSWNSASKRITLIDLMDDIVFAAPTNLIVTGGEPFEQPHIYKFFDTLRKTEIKNIAVETGGVEIDDFFLLHKRGRISIIADYKPRSAGIKKEHNTLNYDNLRSEDVVKFPVATDEDLDEAIKMWQHLAWNEHGPKFAFTPIFPMTAEKLFERLRCFPDSFRINGQLHKYLGLA